jgi:predicted amidohydrolase
MVNSYQTTTTPWTPRSVTVALAQFSMSAEPDENLRRAVEMIEAAAARKAHVVCLPELFRSPYFCVEEACARDYSEELTSTHVQKTLSDVARRAGIAVIGGSLYERTSSGARFNTAPVFSAQGDLLGTYRKQHIPHDPNFFERNYFTPGDGGFKVFDLGFARVGVLICYDQWFPEAARAVALSGAEIIFYPTAIGRVAHLAPHEGDWQDAWTTVQRGHAIANNVVVCGVNRVGTEGPTTFWGGSFVCNAFGKVLACGGEQEGLVIADVDLEHSRYVRESWRFFASRRPELYTALTQRLE